MNRDILECQNLKYEAVPEVESFLFCAIFFFFGSKVTAFYIRTETNFYIIILLQNIRFSHQDVIEIDIEKSCDTKTILV